MSDFAFLQLLTLNCSKMVKFGSISILPKLAGPLDLPSVREYPKIGDRATSLLYN